MTASKGGMSFQLPPSLQSAPRPRSEKPGEGCTGTQESTRASWAEWVPALPLQQKQSGTQEFVPEAGVTRAGKKTGHYAATFLSFDC